MTGSRTRRAALALVAAGVLFAAGFGRSSADDAREIVRTPIPNSNFPISLAVRVPAGADTIYFSGLVPALADPKAPKDSIAQFGDTETQANSVFDKLGDALKSQGLGFGDIVMMHVYLAGDPAKGGKLDFAGFQAAYSKHFGTAEQPNKPARAAFQVAALAAPGFLVEVEAIAAKPR
jgi:enamine deaminase RidA (YjgF/YER057c/UK114 family)